MKGINALIKQSGGVSEQQLQAVDHACLPNVGATERHALKSVLSP